MVATVNAPRLATEDELEDEEGEDGVEGEEGEEGEAPEESSSEAE